MSVMYLCRGHHKFVSKEGSWNCNSCYTPVKKSTIRSLCAWNIITSLRKLRVKLGQRAADFSSFSSLHVCVASRPSLATYMQRRKDSQREVAKII